MAYNQSGQWFGEAAANVPAWRIVRFPNGRVQIYPDLKHANNGRIIARAWANYRAQYAPGAGWADFARYLGIDKKPPHRDKGYHSMNDAVSAFLYGYVIRGTLPKNEIVRQKLIELSGYPWE